MFNQTVLLNVTFRFLWIFSQFNSLARRHFGARKAFLPHEEGMRDQR